MLFISSWGATGPRWPLSGRRKEYCEHSHVKSGWAGRRTGTVARWNSRGREELVRRKRTRTVLSNKTVHIGQGRKQHRESRETFDEAAFRKVCVSPNGRPK